MNCAQCQTANGPGSTFCINCGTSLIPAAPAGYGGPASQGAPGAPQYQPGQAGPFMQRSSTLPPANFDLSRLTTVDRIIAGATLVTMISLWLPWYTAKDTVLGITSTASISGTGDHGWLWLEFLVALALLAYLTARAAWEQLPFGLPVAHERLLTGRHRPAVPAHPDRVHRPAVHRWPAGVLRQLGLRRLPRPDRVAGRGGAGRLPRGQVLPGQPQGRRAPARRDS